MGDAFNPYSHWLKLPQQRWKPTYYEILGIERSAKEKDEIIARGKKLYAEVKAAPLAGREKEHKALLGEIEEAVRTFASNTKRADYDAHLDPVVGELNADTKLLASVPTALATPRVPHGASKASESLSEKESAPSAFSMPPMAVPKPVVPLSVGAVAPAANPPQAKPIARPIAQPIATASNAPTVAISTGVSAPKSTAAASAERHRRAQSRNNSLLIAITGGGVLLVIVLGVLFRGQIAEAIASRPAKPPEEEPSKIEKVAVNNTKPAGTGETKPTDVPQKDPPEKEGGKTEPKPETTPEMKPEEKPEVKPEVKPEMKPEEKPEPPPMPITFSAEEAMKLAAHCNAMIAAVMTRDAAKAAAELEQAELLAKPPAAKATVEQLATVVGPFRAFWGAFDDAWKGLKVDDEIAVGASTKVKVAAISETELEIETASGKRKQTRETISTGLLIALVRTKLDPASPDGKLALALFHLIDKSGNVTEGAKLLAEVNSTGLSPEIVKSTLASKFDFSSQVTGAAAMETAPPSTDTTPPSGDAAQGLIAKLRAAERDRNLVQIDKLAADLSKLAELADAKPTLAAEVQLAKYTEQFWKVVEKGMASFEGTEEIKIGEEIIIVIEKAPKKLICRVRGKRAEYTLKDIPPGLALAIAEMTSDKTSAAFDLAAGAVYFTQKTPQADKAKASWEAAKGKGAEAADLLLMLAP